jgi:hypothetical protein
VEESEVRQLKNAIDRIKWKRSLMRKKNGFQVLSGANGEIGKERSEKRRSGTKLKSKKKGTNEEFGRKASRRGIGKKGSRDVGNIGIGQLENEGLDRKEIFHFIEPIVKRTKWNGRMKRRSRT